MATRKKGSTSGGSNGRKSDLAREQERLTRRLGERADQLTEHAQHLAAQAEGLAAEAEHRTRRSIERRPMTSVWTAFGVGVGLGLAVVALLPHRDERAGWLPDDWSIDDLGGSLRHLSDRVESLGRTAASRASGVAHDVGDAASGYAHDLGKAAGRARRTAGSMRLFLISNRGGPRIGDDGGRRAEDGSQMPDRG